MKIFITGANGFIGSHLAPLLIKRGHAVTCLVRDPQKADKLAAIGATLAAGDITDRATMREPMRGADAVFHLAGWYAIGQPDKAKMHAINVEGARHTLELAAELGVPKIIHTSTVGVFGNTHGQMPDETYRVGKEAMGSEYERTKWAAHYEVAEGLQKQGAPVIITQPGGVTGAGDPSPHVSLFEYFLRRMPVMFGARSGLTLAHVDDIAEGHALALEKGRPGQNYILAGPCLTYRQVFEVCEKITGIPATKVWAPGWLAAGLSKLAGLFEAMGVRMQFSAEALGSLADYTFWASADKAQRELGWTPRPVEATLRDVLEDLRQRK
jgi:nucleoside-diphosphate-sugar epimerase